MFSKTVLLALFASFSTIFAAPPADAHKRNYTPGIIIPNSETRWLTGHTYNVTWDISNPPKDAAFRKNATIVLSKAGILLDDESAGGLQHPLASRFDIHQRFHEVKVPDVEEGNDYAVVLFGNSGDTSPMFTIYSGF